MSQMFLIDFQRVQTLDDMKVVLAACGVAVSGTSPNFDQVKRFIDPEDLARSVVGWSILDRGDPKILDPTDQIPT